MGNTYDGVNYTAEHDVEYLTREQLQLIARSDNTTLISYLEDRTRFDVHRIRLLLEMGQIEARRRLISP